MESAQATIKPGLFIVIEGMDGSGKTTAVSYIAKKLEEREIKHIATREPGGTPVASVLRTLITSKQEETIDPMARLLMIYAGRIQHINHLILPVLAAGQVVLCDRFSDSTYVYQGCMDGLNEAMLMIENMSEMRYLSYRPDVTLFMDVKPEVSIERTKNERVSDNTLTEGNLETLQQHYLHYHARMKVAAQTHPDTTFLIDANLPQEEVNKYLDSFVNKIIERLS